MFIKVSDASIIDMEVNVSPETWSDYFVAKLAEKFQSRKLKNSKYSLRQWAKTLQLSIGAVSEILSKSRKITKARALEIMPLAQFTEYEISYVRALMGLSPKFVSASVEAVGERGVMVLRFIEMRGGKVTREQIEAGLVRTEKLNDSNLIATIDDLVAKQLLVKFEDQSVALASAKLPVFYEVRGTKSPKEELSLDCSFVGSAEELNYIRQSLAKLLREVEVFRHSQAKDTVYRLSLQLEECEKRN